MSEPWIGEASTTGGCQYALKEGRPACGAHCTTHLLSESAIHGIVGLSSCAAHALIARSAGPVYAEHPHGPGCDRMFTVEHWQEP